MSLWYLGAEGAFKNQQTILSKGGATNEASPLVSISPSALGALGKYIPSETTTLFIAALALLDQKTAGNFGKSSIFIYIACAILTPIFVFLSARSVWRQTQQVGNPTLFKLPRWRMIAATIAFLTWALAIPGFVSSSEFFRFLAIFALIVSPLLVAIEQAFGLDK